jgi:hypothetical protein
MICTDCQGGRAGARERERAREPDSSSATEGASPLMHPHESFFPCLSISCNLESLSAISCSFRLKSSEMFEIFYLRSCKAKGSAYALGFLAGVSASGVQIERRRTRDIIFSSR